MQNHFPAMGRTAVFQKVDCLPGTEQHPAIRHRDRYRCLGQHGADMRGHIVRPLNVSNPVDMPVPFTQEEAFRVRS